MVMRTSVDETHSPKYAHIERERRWLVAPDRRPDLAGRLTVLIEDRYIRGSRMRLRLRRMTDIATRIASLKLTKKCESPGPLARPIVTTYLTEAEYAPLATLPASPLVKRRCKLVGTAFSIDLFEGALAGLELAEIECESEGELLEVQSPEWAIKDLSGESRFNGDSLAALDAAGLANLLAVAD